ncbi:MAG: CsgG/HfaB family protein [Candidatus Eisenbacteria bacterium]
MTSTDHRFVGATARRALPALARTATLALAVALAAPTWAKDTQNDPIPADPLEAAWASYEKYTYQQMDEALSIANHVLEMPDAERDARVTAEKTRVLVHLSRDEVDEATEALKAMLAADPAARFSPEWDYPPQVIDLYHQVQDAGGGGTMDVYTVAVGDFENNSVYVKTSDKFNFDNFRLGLIHTIITDLSASSGLRVVDRQRTEKIVEELQLGQSGYVDPERAAQAGRLLGAHLYVFGQFMILSSSEVRIDMRVVHTATGEVMVAKQITGKYSGKPQNYLDLEKQLVVEVAASVDSLVGDQAAEPGVLQKRAKNWFDTRLTSVEGRGSYGKSKLLVGEALQAEEEKDYRGALRAWQAVLKADPENDDAKRRVLILSGGKT